MNWYLQVLKKYTVFSGRARRREYWLFVLFNMIFAVVAMILDNALGMTILGLPYGIITLIYSLAVIIPSLAVVVRRLHDVGKSGWMIFISLIPIVGAIWLLVLMVTDGDTRDNEYGLSPKDEEIDNFVEFSGDVLISIVIIWMVISRLFFAFIPKIMDNFYATTTFVIINKFTILIWAIIPIGLAFTLKNKSKQLLLFILGGLYFLYGIYEITSQFVK
jgi:uncharacterized membrane protein YhaH (DUF805 family)